MSSSVPFKCYYGNEIRRINLPAGSIAYSQLVERLQEAFSIAPTQQLRLRWVDEEGDKVSLTTNDELQDAVRYLNDRAERHPGKAVRIFVTAVEAAEVHEGVMCDGCEGGVIGHRYKCVLCPDFDLCATCLATGTHSQHPMLLIRKSNEFSTPFGGCRRRWGGGWGGVWGGPRFRSCGNPQFQGNCGAPGNSGAPGNCGVSGRCGGPQFPGFEHFAKAAAAVAAEIAAAATTTAADTGASNDAAAKPPAASAAAASTEETMATDAGSANGNEASVDSRVARALEHMQAMGFNDDGGWLTRLLVAKGGDISAVLDAIRPTK